MEPVINRKWHHWVSGSHLLVMCWFALALQALLEAERLAGELDDVGAVSQAIQQGRGQLFVEEDLSPVGEAQVGGDDERDALVECRAELKHELRGGGSERHKAEFVQHDQAVLEGCSDESLGLML